MGMGGYSNGSPSFYLDQRRRSQAAKQRAFDPRRQTMNLPQPGVATQQPGGVNEFGSPEAGSSGLAPHIAARAGLGAAGRGSQGGLLAANNAHRQLAGMLVGVEQQTPLIAHQPSVPGTPGPAAKPQERFALRLQKAQGLTMAARTPPPVPMGGLVAGQQQQRAQAGQAMQGVMASAPQAGVFAPPDPNQVFKDRAMAGLKTAQATYADEHGPSTPDYGPQMAQRTAARAGNTYPGGFHEFNRGVTSSFQGPQTGGPGGGSGGLMAQNAAGAGARTGFNPVAGLPPSTSRSSRF